MKSKSSTKKKAFGLGIAGLLLTIGTIIGIYKYTSGTALTQLPDQVRIEYEKESQTIDEYDAEILKIDNQLSSTTDKTTRRGLDAKRKELVDKREKLAKRICTEYEEWQYKHRYHRPDKNK